ncbi:MAG: SGNH/GDSL hydrolase family protein [Acidobacteriota bacterium]
MKILRALAANVVVPLALALGLFLVLEGGCRAAGRVTSGAWPATRAEERAAFSRHVRGALARHPYLVVAGRPGGSLDLAGISVRMNARGYRGSDVPMPKPAGRYRIVCTGGSTTFDVRAADDAHTWPALFGARLAAKDVDVVNAGISGWTTVESLISLALRDLDLAPDLVVVYAGINDAQPAGFSPFARDYARGHAEILASTVGVDPPPFSLFSRSLLVQALGDALRGRRRGDAVHEVAWKGTAARSSDVPDEAVAVFERNLRSTIAVARSGGARTLLVAQSVRLRRGREAADREYYESWTPGLTFAGAEQALRRFNAVSRGLADGHDVFFLDPFASGTFVDADFADPVHFAAAGADRFAGVLAAFITGPDGPLAASRREQPPGTTSR